LVLLSSGKADFVAAPHLVITTTLFMITLQPSCWSTILLWRIDGPRQSGFRRIFSETCKAKVQYVSDLTKLTGGTVTLLHVGAGRSASYGAADVYSGFDTYERLLGPKEMQMSALATFRDEYFDGLAACCHLAP
jgi:hypothetical protein